MTIKLQKAYRIPNKWDQKRKSSCHIIVKTLNPQNKERILKTAKEKGQVTYEVRPIRITPDFSTETMKTRKAWSEVMQTQREHKCQLRLLYPSKLSININGVNKTCQDKTKFKQYLSINPALQRILERKLHNTNGIYTKEKTRY
jgi:superfamily II RNA helicase